MKKATRKVVLRLKEVREQKHLTYQEIVDICENNREAVSLSSVKRLFAPGSEDKADYRRSTLEVNSSNSLSVTISLLPNQRLVPRRMLRGLLFLIPRVM